MVDAMLLRAEASRTFGKEETATVETLRVLIEAAATRRKQVEKGYTPEHDDEEGLKHLLHVAQTYAVPEDTNPTNSLIRQSLLDQIGTLIAAVEVIDRATELAL